MFDKTIITVWLSEKPTPSDIQQWISTHEIPGFTHKLITLDNLPRGIKYVDRAVERKNWAKAVDYFRTWYLWTYGGIYLDADIEVVDSSFLEHLVNYMEREGGPSLLCEREANGFIANSFLMAFSGQLYLKRFMERIEKAHGEDDEVWNCGMGAWTDFIHQKACIPADKTVLVLEPWTYFGSHMIHHFLRSWKKPNQSI